MTESPEALRSDRGAADGGTSGAEERKHRRERAMVVVRNTGADHERWSSRHLSDSLRWPLD